MFEHLAPQFRYRVKGSETKIIVCEKCSHEYPVQVHRTGEGVAQTAPVIQLVLGSASHRAAEQAERSLAARLARGIEPVPCPRCRWLQNNMVNEIRRRSYGPLLWLGAGGLILTIFFFWIAILFETRCFDIPMPQEGKVFLICLVCLGVVCIGLLIVRWQLVRKLEPNAGWFPLGESNLLAETAPSPPPPPAPLVQYAPADLEPSRRPVHPAVKPAIVFAGGGVLGACGVVGFISTPPQNAPSPLVFGALIAGIALFCFGIKCLKDAGY